MPGGGTDPQDTLIPNVSSVPTGYKQGIKRYWLPQLLDGAAMEGSGQINLITATQVQGIEGNSPPNNQLLCPMVALPNTLASYDLWCPGQDSKGMVHFHQADPGCPISLYLGKPGPPPMAYYVFGWSASVKYNSVADAGWTAYEGQWYLTVGIPTLGSGGTTIGPPASPPGVNLPLYIDSKTGGIGPVVGHAEVQMQLSKITINYNDGMITSLIYGPSDVSYSRADNDPDSTTPSYLDPSGTVKIGQSNVWNFYSNLTPEWNGAYAPPPYPTPLTYGMSIGAASGGNLWGAANPDGSLPSPLVAYKSYLDPGPPHYPQVIILT